MTTQGRRSARMRGLTIVELLIAGAILVIVLALAATFFAQQTRLQREVQTRNEVQDRVRVAMQLVSQDLALVGNSVLIRADGSIDDLAGLTGGGGCQRASYDAEFPDVENCLALVDRGDMISVPPYYESALSLRYLSSQFAPTAACRDVRYQLTDAGMLQRSDVACGAIDEGAPDPLDLVPGIEAFSLVVVCSDGARLTTFPSAACDTSSTPPAFGRSAIVSIVARSLTAVPGTDAARSVATTNPSATQSVECPPNRVCFGATEEILMPNMKDR